MDRKARIGIAALLASMTPVLAGLVASAMLAVDYLHPTPVFCSEGGGCDAVRQTVFASVLGVPTPIVGLSGFLAIGCASLMVGRWARVAQVVLASVAAAAGLFLLAVQTKLGHFCPYCCVADASSVASAAAAWWRFARVPSERFPNAVVYASAAALAAAAFVPLGIGWGLAARAPEAIRAEMAQTREMGRPKDVTVVDFVDFECPYCRMTQAAFEPILEAHRDRVRLVRRQVPLHVHAHALDAARAACCGERLGQGDAMARALFSAPVDQLTREGCEKMAESLGLPLEPYRACVVDPATDARIESDRAEFKAAGGHALPTLWIDGHEIIGAQARAALEQAIDDALVRAGG
jgi:uncharacterized membrane protein/predicted DsbA family dithiol-disulfide isomerase